MSALATTWSFPWPSDPVAAGVRRRSATLALVRDLQSFLAKEAESCAQVAERRPVREERGIALREQVLALFTPAARKLAR